MLCSNKLSVVATLDLHLQTPVITDRSRGHVDIAIVVAAAATNPWALSSGKRTCQTRGVCLVSQD